MSKEFGRHDWKLRPCANCWEIWEYGAAVIKSGEVGKILIQSSKHLFSKEVVIKEEIGQWP